MSTSPPIPGSGRFPTTRWTLILSARTDEGQRRSALDSLCATYWKPIYLYTRRKGLSPDAAQDAVQGLFAQLIERDFLTRLDPAKGKLRSYLRTAADHYLSHQRTAANAQKRGGRVRTLCLDASEVEPHLAAAPEDPLLAFEREWALAVMNGAMARLRAEYTEGRRRGNAEVIFRFFGAGTPPSYAEAAAEAGVGVPQLKAALHRARARFREILLDEVADTVDGASAAEELSHLLRLLSS